MTIDEIIEQIAAIEKNPDNRDSKGYLKQNPRLIVERLRRQLDAAMGENDQGREP
jgi:hypothetical protein